VPDRIHPQFTEKKAWLSEDRGRCTTSPEIAYRVMNNLETAEKAFFYIIAGTLERGWGLTTRSTVYAGR
jgi:hypothetical protein